MKSLTTWFYACYSPGMLTPAYFPLRTPRFTAMSFNLSIDQDLTGKTFKAQVRKTPNDGGAALLTLNTTVVPNALGIRQVAVLTETDGTKRTLLHFYAPLASIESAGDALGLSADELADDNDIVLSWDVHMMDATGTTSLLAYGPFILRAGVTQHD
jgi:hypothetical protein